MQEEEKQKLIELIKSSKLLSESEKTEWLSLLDIMSEIQLTELKNILISAVPVLPKLEKKTLEKTEIIIPPLKHILNLPKTKESIQTPVVLKTEKEKKPSKFWQKVKNILTEKELPAGHKEPTEELELPERVILPNSIVTIPEKKQAITLTTPVLSKTQSKPTVPVPQNKSIQNNSSVNISPKPILKNVDPSPVLKQTLIKPIKPVLPPEKPKSVEIKPNVDLPKNNFPHLTTLKVDKLVLGTESKNTKKVETEEKEDTLETLVNEQINTDLQTSKIKELEVSEVKNISKSTPLVGNLATNNPNSVFVAGLKDTNVLVDAKFAPKVKKQIPTKILPPASDFTDVKQISLLDKSILNKDLVVPLKKAIMLFGFHQVYEALEKSPLFQSYIDSGLIALSGKTNVTLENKNALSREEFIQFVDVLRAIKT